jgi:N-dimethylarginine dimethylaminohydrolase
MALNEYGRIESIALRHARDAFLNPASIAEQRQKLNYHSAPDFDAAIREYDAFVEALSLAGAQVHLLPAGDDLTLDAIYVRDSAIPGPEGVILCNMGKPARSGEPLANGAGLDARGIEIAGRIGGNGRLEGGDFVWFDDTTCAVAHGYRTNAEGIRQLRDLLGPDVHVEVCPLPHYKGPEDVFHLMSILSPLDRDLALVYSPLMPVPFRNWLIERGLRFVEVPDEEFESMGCNVLATAPRRCLMVEGNPETHRRLEAAGCEVVTYPGAEISRKGEGGPTCLTRPLVRDLL